MVGWRQDGQKICKHILLCINRSLNKRFIYWIIWIQMCDSELTKSTDNTYKMSLYLRCWKPLWLLPDILATWIAVITDSSCFAVLIHSESFCWNFISKIYFPFNSLLSMINKSISHFYIWVCFFLSLYLDMFTMEIIRFCIYKSKIYKNTKRYVFIF